MSKIGGMEEDLRYVRSVLDRSEGGGTPASIYFLWAAICLVGYALIDLAPERAMVFWAVAGPAGGAASFFLGWWGSRRLGQESRREGLSHILHWTGMMAAIFLVVPLAVLGTIPPRALPSLVLLIVALGYWTAGIYLDRRLLYIGAIMAACYLATVLFARRSGIWTAAGAALALSLVAAGWVGRGSPDRPEGEEARP